MKAWAFLLLLSCGHVTEVKVLKQICSHFVQIEGCKRQFIQVLRKAAEEKRNSPGKITGFGFFSSSHGKEVVNSFQGKLLKEGERVAWMGWTQIKTVLSEGFVNEMTVHVFLFYFCHIFILDNILNACQGPLISLKRFCRVVCHSIRQQILDKTDSNILIHCNQLRLQNIHHHLGLKAVLI